MTAKIPTKREYLITVAVVAAVIMAVFAINAVYG